MTSGFGTIRQLGFVVPDIDAAVRHWVERVGVGPFFYIEAQPLSQFVYRGQTSEPIFSVALAQHGPIQIELIQQRNGAPSAFKEFTDARREGLQHIAYWTEDFEALCSQVTKAGHVEVQSGRSGSGGPNERFAYFDGNGPQGTIIEVSEVMGAKAALFTAVADAASNWTGADPIRDMSELVSA
ncbi:VOC family protein [Mycolicibacterium goodii]|uniref:Glyoxalase n=1 Tax=Mycolicibacterium goodii TaxID=134601 RepID=A0A0K0X3H0_MYCGD|nr:glyoxalase [Mycolicibacterium goodii]